MSSRSSPKPGVIWRHTRQRGQSPGVHWPGDRPAGAPLYRRRRSSDRADGLRHAGRRFGATGRSTSKQRARRRDGGFSLASPPSVYKNIVITGGNNGEQSPVRLYGDIRGWDARTGKLLWSFTRAACRRPGVETWEGDSWKNRSGTNVWAFFTIDTERGLVFAPTARRRPTITAGTAKARPLRQLHQTLDANRDDEVVGSSFIDIWDYDVPRPDAVDVKRDGSTIPAVAVVTKMALVFIFDRHWRAFFTVEERPRAAEHGARRRTADATISRKPG